MQPRERLTEKEIQVATLVWEGLTNREIANIIGTTEQVIKNYLRNTFDKLGVWSRLELALYIAAHGGSDWTHQLGIREMPLKRVLQRASRAGLVPPNFAERTLNSAAVNHLRRAILTRFFTTSRTWRLDLTPE
jgi:DNA-binding CsgD family transcriptional regulator